MIGMQLTGACPVCRERFGMTLGGESIVSESWRTFYRCYQEHYDAVHVDSWQKLARDAVRQWRLCGPLPGSAVDLELRLEKLEKRS